MPNKLSQFWQELKRRNVVRVITVYAGAAFVLLELVDIITEPFGLPDWTMILVVVLLSVGFIISVIISWIYDIHPQGGIVKTEPVHKEKPEDVPVSSSSWKIASYISFVVIVGLILFHILSSNNKSREISNLETSIAVLPFENMSNDEEYSHIGGAFTDEIIMELQKIKAFDRVLSRTSTMQYVETRPTIPEIAEKLNVNYIVEGSIQRHKEDVSIRIQVIRAINEDHIWADEYDGQWKDIFSIQDEIAFKVATELKTVLSSEEVERIKNEPTENIEAYNLYLQGRYFWHRRTEKDLNRSIYYFNQAIELDTFYALAYAGLADAYFIMAWWGWYPANDGYNKGKEYAIKALSINKNISEAHATLGGIATYHEWNWDMAEMELKQAISLNPNYASAYQYYSELFDILGKNGEAREQINLSLKLNPHSYSMYALSGLYYYHNKDYEKAIEEYEKGLEIRNSNFHIAILKSYVKLGMNNEALEHIKSITSIDASSNNHELLDIIYQESGIEGIIYWLIDWIVVDNPHYPSHSIASLYAITGDSQIAIEYLEKAFENGEARIPRINNNPDFDFLREDPRFISLLKKMNL